MNAEEFTNKWIDLDEDYSDIGNSSVPVMVECGKYLFSVKDVKLDLDEEGKSFVLIKTESIEFVLVKE